MSAMNYSQVNSFFKRGYVVCTNGSRWLKGLFKVPDLTQISVVNAIRDWDGTAAGLPSIFLTQVKFSDVPVLDV